ncbi:MAG TPA: hypothetical protein ENJ82_12325 [Bacteroidetes bacterium]|nr:hypothetical protein [Bacteroidota bacterium]
MNRSCIFIRILGYEAKHFKFMKNQLEESVLTIAAILFVMLNFSACVPVVKQNTDGTVVQDSVVVEVDKAKAECANLEPGQFCVNGLDFLALGEDLTWNDSIKVDLEGVTLKDTAFEQVIEGPNGLDTTGWFVKLVNFPDGKQIFLEADFENPHVLGRVRIETPAYLHASGVGVGSTVAELKEKFPELLLLPFTEYGVMELIVPYGRRKMIFHVPLGDYYNAEKEEYLLGDIPEGEKVIRVVLM